MGRKAKLKKQRRQAQLNKSDVPEVNDRDFIGRMAKEGYRLDDNKRPSDNPSILRSPEVPRDNIEPQV